MTDPIRTEKGNILPQEVWVTFWDFPDKDRAYLSGLSDEPWEPTYDAPITKYADNVRYVPAPLLEEANAEVVKLRNAAALVIRWFDDHRPDLIGPRIEALRAVVWPQNATPEKTP